MSLGHVQANATDAATTPAQTSVGTTAGRILLANPGRKGFMVQNTGTTILKLAFGRTVPTQTAYHKALPPGTGSDDGMGGSYADDSWIGDVQAISSDVGGTCVVTEFA